MLYMCCSHRYSTNTDSVLLYYTLSYIHPFFVWFMVICVNFDAQTLAIFFNWIHRIGNGLLFVQCIHHHHRPYMASFIHFRLISSFLLYLTNHWSNFVGRLITRDSKIVFCSERWILKWGGKWIHNECGQQRNEKKRTKKLNGFSCIELYSFEEKKMKWRDFYHHRLYIFILHHSFVSFNFTIHTVYLIQSCCFFLFFSHVYFHYTFLPFHWEHLTSWKCILTISMFVESKYISTMHMVLYSSDCARIPMPSCYLIHLCQLNWFRPMCMHIARCLSFAYFYPLFLSMKWMFGTLSHCNCTKKTFIYSLQSLSCAQVYFQCLLLLRLSTYQI